LPQYTNSFGVLDMFEKTEQGIICRRCGSQNLIKKGYAYSSAMKGTRKQKYQCKECGIKTTGNVIEMVEPMPFKYQDQPLPKRDFVSLTQAQLVEKQMALEMLEELFDRVEIIVDPEKKGRKNFNPKDMLIVLALKTLNKSSSRRLASDLELARQEGFLEETPYFTTMMAYARKPEMLDLITELVRLSALPIKQLQDSFVCAMDATGVGTCQLNGAWLEFKHGKEEHKSIRNWVKLNGLIDTATNLFLSADVTIGTAGDSPYLAPLVQLASKDFRITTVTADKGYSGRKNFEIIKGVETLPIMTFKSNATGNKRGSMIWSKCFQYYKEHPQEYLQIYHQRSKIEAVFGALKKRFGETVLTKSLAG
jgi:DNA-directed RNA polymerase subunit RPC12/RpoP